MQRNITYKNPLTIYIYFTLFLVYESLSTIYVFLPPLLSVLFVLFADAIKKEKLVNIILLIFSLIYFETEYGYLLFSSIIYFLLIYRFVIPFLNQNFNCYACIRLAYVLLAYVGFYFFIFLLSSIFLLPIPDIYYYIVYYIVIEFFIVSLI